MVDVMGKKRVFGIAVILGLTLLNVWMARYVVKPMNERRLYKQATLVRSRPEKADILVISVDDIHPIDHLKQVKVTKVATRGECNDHRGFRLRIESREAKQEDENKVLSKENQSKRVAHAHSVYQGPKSPIQKDADVEAGMWKIDGALMNLDTDSLAHIKLKLQNIKDALQARKIQNGALEMKSGYLGVQGQASSSGTQTRLLHKREHIQQNDPGIPDVGGAFTGLHSPENAVNPKISIFKTKKPTARRVTSKYPTVGLSLTSVKTPSPLGFRQKPDIFAKTHHQNFRQTGPDPHFSAISTIQGRVIDPNPVAVTQKRKDRKQTAAPLYAREQEPLGRIVEPAISIPENFDSGPSALLPGHHMAEDTAISNKGKPQQYDFIRRINDQMVENIVRDNQLEANTAERAMRENILRDVLAGQLQIGQQNVPGQ